PSHSQFPSRLPRGDRTSSSREARPAFRVKEMIDTAVKANRGHRPEFALISLRRFRRLFATAQSTTFTKLANPLIGRGFRVSRETSSGLRPMAQGLPGWTAEIMTKACARG